MSSAAVSQDLNNGGGWSAGSCPFSSAVRKVQDFSGRLGGCSSAAGDSTSDKSFVDKCFLTERRGGSAR
jgi:hypothetical protein